MSIYHQYHETENLMSFLLIVHSYLRWLIVIVALFAILKFAWSWLRGGTFQRLDRGLASGFSGIMDLQAMLGLIFLVWNGVAGAGFPMFRIEHAVTMVVAAAVAHLPARWKNTADKLRFRNLFFVILGTLAIIFIGVARLPGGWGR
jgi:hypothetical protein